MRCKLQTDTLKLYCELTAYRKSAFHIHVHTCFSDSKSRHVNFNYCYYYFLYSIVVVVLLLLLLLLLLLYLAVLSLPSAITQQNYTRQQNHSCTLKGPEILNLSFTCQRKHLRANSHLLQQSKKEMNFI